MKTIPVQKARDQKLKPDPHYPASIQRAKEVAQHLRWAGIIDAEGRRIRQDLPADMRAGSRR